MNADSRIAVHFNSKAGVDRITAEELTEKLGADLVRIVPMEPADIVAEAKKAAARGDAMFCVAGGDGTLHGVANELSGTETALACVPVGTINNFAKRLHIDTLEAAAAALRAQEFTTVALGAVGDRIFLNTLTFGEYARVVRMRDRMRPYIGKWTGALVGFVATTLTLRRMHIGLTVAEEHLSRRTPFMWVGVGWGSFPRVNQALERRDRPDLEVAIVRPARTLRMIAFVLRTGVRVLRGDTPVRDAHIEILHARSLGVDARHRIDATIDGEATRIAPPVHIAVKDEALRVLTGPGYGTA
jgi:diacylglycerol kinase family enzyme